MRVWKIAGAGTLLWLAGGTLYFGNQEIEFNREHVKPLIEVCPLSTPDIESCIQHHRVTVNYGAYSDTPMLLWAAATAKAARMLPIPLLVAGLLWFVARRSA